MLITCIQLEASTLDQILALWCHQEQRIELLHMVDYTSEVKHRVTSGVNQSVRHGKRSNVDIRIENEIERSDVLGWNPRSIIHVCPSSMFF